jgi:hypothetical protein
MRQTRCDGCGRTEPADTPKTDTVMQRVVVMVVTDGRSWATDSAPRIEADLCSRCRPQMLSTFFGVPADVDEELPAWLSKPVSAIGG